MFQEVKPNIVDRIEDLELPLEKVLEELMDGDIIVFQKLDLHMEEYELPTVKDYFRSVNRVAKQPCDNFKPPSPNCSLQFILMVRKIRDRMASTERWTSLNMLTVGRFFMMVASFIVY